jgi:hypothetical protein
MATAAVRRQRVSQKAATTRAQPYALSLLLRAATGARERGSARGRTASERVRKPQRVACARASCFVRGASRDAVVVQGAARAAARTFCARRAAARTTPTVRRVALRQQAAGARATRRGGCRGAKGRAPRM